jgi:hypothetical protein
MMQVKGLMHFCGRPSAEGATAAPNLRAIELEDEQGRASAREKVYGIDHKSFLVAIRICVYRQIGSCRGAFLSLRGFPVIREDLTETAPAIQFALCVLRQLLL